MYIEPNSVIRLLTNVPLDPTYDHTIYWDDVTADLAKAKQIRYFSSMTKHLLQRQTYQRVQRGFINVGITAEDLYDCNYLMFQNTSFGSKWFYAFIKSVEYVNNAISRVEYEIDVMQTWFFDYELEECFVEREHSITDELFENIVTENLEIGNEYVNNALAEYDMNDMSLCVLVNRVTPTGVAPTRVINNICTPMYVLAGLRISNDPVDIARIEALFNEYQESDIVAVYQYPAVFGDGFSTTEPITVNKAISPNITSIDGYVPKNKKLFSSPYNKLIVSNNSGDIAEYKWENFSDINAPVNFNITGVFVSTPCVICYPTNYRGIANAYDDGLLYANFPQCPWSGDVFKAWWAQNKASFVTSGLTSVLSSLAIGSLTGAAAMAFTTNPAIAAATAVTSVASTTAHVQGYVANALAKIQDIKNTPSQTHGQSQTDSLNPGMRRVKFSFYNVSIKAQFARIIDEYFTRFGYATHRTKVPNRNVRPFWTFTKTTDCTIRGSIPADDITAICRIYNAGVTFWKDPYAIGNYSLDNSPVSETQEEQNG